MRLDAPAGFVAELSREARAGPLGAQLERAVILLEIPWNFENRVYLLYRRGHLRSEFVRLLASEACLRRHRRDSVQRRLHLATTVRRDHIRPGRFQHRHASGAPGQGRQVRTRTRSWVMNCGHCDGFSGSRSRRRHSSLRSERGSPFTRAGLARMIERAGVEAGLGFQAHPHVLRHACGFALANKGHDTRALQAYLGHRNIQHTVRYTELSPQRFKDFWR